MTFMALTAAVCLSVSWASASEEEFFKGKVLRFVVGFSPGGGFDTYTRLIARHIGKHVPGNPQTLVQNMTGAGSLIAANYIYNKAKPDGLTVGNWIGPLVLQDVLGNKAAQFDGRKFGWLGAPTVDSGVCALTKASGIQSVKDWFDAKTPVKIGGSAPGSTTDDPPLLVRTAIGLPLQVITGYPGTARIRLAAERGEVAGGCWAWQSIKVTWRRGIETGAVKPVLQTSLQSHPELKDVPLAIDYAKTDEARRLLKVAADVYGATARPYSTPPGLPKERLETLQKAFMDTMKDPEFLAEAKKSNIEIAPLDGPSITEKMTALYSMDPELLAKVKEIIVPKK